MQPAHGLDELARMQRQTAVDMIERLHGFGNALDAAQAAAGRPDNRAPPADMAPGNIRFQPHPRLDALFDVDDFERVDVVRRGR